MNWGYYTDPDPNMLGRRIYWPRGRTLGGSSAINGLIYIRGQRADYDAWAAAGNPAGAGKTACPTSAGWRTTTWARARRAAWAAR